ncbi:MAG TPA: ATP-binding protein [Steroidobacteraceae bacterium]
MSGSTRTSRLGLYVGLSLALPASLVLAGAALWLAFGGGSRIEGGVAAAIVAAASACLIGTALVGIPALRERSAQAAQAPGPIAVPRPSSPEEAAALAHAQKMEALGLLAGEVAHDFNNLLHVIGNALEILQRPEQGIDTHRYLEMIRRSTDRAATLTRQLLAFARRQPIEVRPIDANELVAQMAELLRHSLGERITVETVLGQGVGSVAADAGQLETALLNLAINARDAMPQAGLLTLETAGAMLDEQYVVIAVSDTGTGMSPEVAARACEPFFTTKEPGRGTGLGLSQVAGFAYQSGGRVRIASEPGKGTTVRLFLPRNGRPARAAPKQQAAPVYAWSIKKETQRSMPLAIGAGPER